MCRDAWGLLQSQRDVNDTHSLRRHEPSRTRFWHPIAIDPLEHTPIDRFQRRGYHAQRTSFETDGTAYAVLRVGGNDGESFPR